MYAIIPGLEFEEHTTHTPDPPPDPPGFAKTIPCPDVAPPPPPPPEAENITVADDAYVMVVAVPLSPFA